MIHSLKIGQLIYQRLSTDEAFVSRIGHSLPDSKKIFPIIADNDTKFPVVLYTRQGVNPDRMTKDGFCQDTVTFQITVASDSYDESVEVADMVRNLLEMKYMANEEISLTETYMISCNESYNNETYIQQLLFTTKVKNV